MRWPRIIFFLTAGKKTDKIGLSGFPAPYISNASPGSCGYVHSADTGLYYLQSRYYNPAIGRFINADALVSTGQGMLGNNMFAYCRNNPVCRKDVSGRDDVECTDLDGNPSIDEEDIKGGGNPGGSSTSGSSTGNGSSNSGSSSPGSSTSGTGGSIVGGTKADPPRYPADPKDFNPSRLDKKVYVQPGTGPNGGIIKWEIPGTNTAIFEWNEDYKKGSHYHAMNVELGNVHINHLHAGDIIEEPWRDYL